MNRKHSNIGLLQFIEPLLVDICEDAEAGDCLIPMNGGDEELCRYRFCQSAGCVALKLKYVRALMADAGVKSEETFSIMGEAT